MACLRRLCPLVGCTEVQNYVSSYSFKRAAAHRIAQFWAPIVFETNLSNLARGMP